MIFTLIISADKFIFIIIPFAKYYKVMRSKVCDIRILQYRMSTLGKLHRRVKNHIKFVFMLFSQGFHHIFL